MGYQKQLIRANLLKIKQGIETDKITKIKQAEGRSDLKDIKGIGDATLTKLYEMGIKTKKQLKEIGKDGLKNIKLNPLSLKGILNFLKL